MVALLVTLAGGCSDDDGPGGDASAVTEAGGGEEGFGDTCSMVAQPCLSGFFCSKDLGDAVGFCTKQCGALGETCPGAPAGTRASCLLQLVPSGFACAFVCDAGGQQGIGCPAGLSCKTDKPLSGGLYRCLP